MNNKNYDVIIAGCGAAGLYAALNLSRDLNVLVLSKRELTLCNSSLAQGGIAGVYDNPKDSPEYHKHDTFVAGGFENDPESTQVLVDEAYIDIEKLIELGADFDKCPDGSYHRTLEGGHGMNRIFHHADTTGLEIETTLLRNVQQLDNVEILENAVMCNAKKTETGFSILVLTNDNEYTTYNCRYAIFATGGIGRVCSRLGVELETYSVNWDTKEQDLNAGTIDCIWNGLSVSDERKKVMLMSEPYMKNEMVFVVNGSSDVASQADLAGKNIAVQNGSTAQETLLASDVVANGATTTELATNVEALQQLELNMVDAAFLDSVVANYEISTSGKDYKVLPDGLDPEEYAIGFRLGDQALCDKIEEILHEMKQDGKLAEISTSWFGSDITTIE